MTTLNNFANFSIDNSQQTNTVGGTYCGGYRYSSYSYQPRTYSYCNDYSYSRSSYCDTSYSRDSYSCDWGSIWDSVCDAWSSFSCDTGVTSEPVVEERAPEVASVAAA